MKKLFLAICFNLLWAQVPQAKVTEVLDQSQLPQGEMPQQDKVEVKPVSAEELSAFLSERLERTVIQPKDKVKTKATDAQPSEQTQQAIDESEKGTFQKIYESALQRLEQQDAAAAARQDINTPQLQDTAQQQRQAWETPDFPVIRTVLPPNGQPVLVPAREHIPYLMSNIEILPDGMIKFTDTAVVVANGQKLRNGLSKLLPKEVFSRSREAQKITYTLIGVSANGQDLPYRLADNGNNILLIPEKNYILEPGVYTYKFEYLADNLLWDYGNFKELYWDVTGSAWDLVIARAGATLSVPEGANPLGQEIFVGHPQNLDAGAAAVLNPSPNVWGYAATRPLFVGEGLHLVVSLPENVTVPPSWDKRLMRQFESFGDVYISLITFVAIALSFLLSWKYIRANKGQLKVSLKKTPAILRYLAFNRYDLKSFSGFLLDLYRKNIIDIQQADDTILLIKRTDNLKSLTRREQKAVGCLFTHDEPVLNINKNNLLKIRRAAREIEKDLRSSLLRFLLKLNGGYLFFSFGMLFLGELFIALAGLNSLQTFIVLAGATLLTAAGMILFTQTSHRLWSSILLKAAGSLIIMLSVVAMAAVVSLWSIVFILLSLLAIRHYTAAYGQRNGLLKQHIEETSKLRDNLRKHRDSILLGREIANQQPIIWVLDMEDDFISEPANEYNKLNTMLAFLKKISA